MMFAAQDSKFPKIRRTDDCSGPERPQKHAVFPGFSAFWEFRLGAASL
jgi:hypothetical protein